jgi:hypothetical protein
MKRLTKTQVIKMHNLLIQEMEEVRALGMTAC